MKNNILFVLIGLIFFIYLVYNRLFRNRIPFNFTNYLSDARLIIYFFIILCFSVVIFMNIIKLYKFIYKIEKESLFSEYLKKLYKHKYNPFYLLQESLIDLDAFIKNNAPCYDERRSYIDVVIMNIGDIFCKHCKQTLTFIILIRNVPQSIVCSCFIYDILYHPHFIFFYRSLFILILPLIINYILHSMKIIIDSNLEQLDQVLRLYIIPSKEFTGETSQDQLKQVDIYSWALLESHKENEFYCFHKLSDEYIQETEEKSDQLLVFCVSNMNKFFNMQKFLTLYQTSSIYFECPFNIIKSFIYVIGWSFICLKGLHLI